MFGDTETATVLISSRVEWERTYGKYVPENVIFYLVLVILTSSSSSVHWDSEITSIYVTDDSSTFNSTITVRSHNNTVVGYQILMNIFKLIITRNIYFVFHSCLIYKGKAKEEVEIRSFIIFNITSSQTDLYYTHQLSSSVRVVVIAFWWI